MRLLFFILLSSVIFSCGRNSASNLRDREAIAALLLQERKAHFDRNVTLFVSEFSDSMISVNRGVAKYTPPDTMQKSIQQYFSGVNFVKWDDVAEPLIRFSTDRTLAYAIVQKEVIISYRKSSGETVFDTTMYAWTSIYRKQGNSWKLEANTSTNK